jgi:hypothetical protein
MRSKVTGLIAGEAAAACLSRPVSAFGFSRVVKCCPVSKYQENQGISLNAVRCNIIPYQPVSNNSVAKCSNKTGAASRAPVVLIMVLNVSGFLRSPKSGIEFGGGVGLHVRHQMAVCVHRDRDAVMAEPLLDDFRMHVFCQ